MLGFLKNISPTEIVIVVFIFVVLFGGKAATKLGKLGGETFREMKNIKKSVSEVGEAVDSSKPKKGQK
jgi:Sec-independent protein translocase protein TatA